MANNEVSFDATKAERAAVRRIAKRGCKIVGDLTGQKRDQLETEMDLIATHANGNPLDFAKMAAFDDFNLLHDLGGIYRHLDRKTGKLTGHFSPRASAKVAA